MIEHGILKGNNPNIIHGILKIVKLTKRNVRKNYSYSTLYRKIKFACTYKATAPPLSTKRCRSTFLICKYDIN